MVQVRLLMVLNSQLVTVFSGYQEWGEEEYLLQGVVSVGFLHSTQYLATSIVSINPDSTIFKLPVNGGNPKLT